MLVGRVVVGGCVPGDGGSLAGDLERDGALDGAGGAVAGLPVPKICFASSIAISMDHLAERLLLHACELFTGAGSQRQAAVAMGSIADIAFRRGDYDEALRIHRDVQLPAYGRLGDLREAAVTWGTKDPTAAPNGGYEPVTRFLPGYNLRSISSAARIMVARLVSAEPGWVASKL